MDLNAFSLPAAEEGLSMADEATARLSAGGVTAEVFLRGGPELSLVYEPTTGRALESVGGALRATCRVWRDGARGVASGDAGGVADLLRVAEEARSRASQGRSVSVPVSAPAPLVAPPPGVGSSEGLSGERARSLARALTEPLAARAGRFQAVLIRQSAGWSALASTAGARALELHPFEDALVRYETGRGAVVEGVSGPLGREPLDAGPPVTRLLSALDTVAEPGGAPEPALPWTLRPAAAAPLVSAMSWLLRGDLAERTPGLLRAVGKKIFPSALTLVDEPGSRRVDDEGTPAAPLRLVEQGRLSRFLHTVESARALGVEPNGRGLRVTGEGEPMPAPFSLRALPGEAAPPPDRNDFDVRLEVFRSMARPGKVTIILAGWVVRGGERVRRIAPLMLELPLLDTFRKLLAAGPDLAFFPGADGCGTPTLTFSPLLERTG